MYSQPVSTPSAIDADDPATDASQKTLRPIVSLISKSEKAQQKLVPGTWQHTMLQGNLKALRIAAALLGEKTNDTDDPTRDNLQEALKVFASMIRKVKETEDKFSPGTAQYTLQRNRLEALRFAEARVKAELDKR